MKLNQISLAVLFFTLAVFVAFVINNSIINQCLDLAGLQTEARRREIRITNSILYDWLNNPQNYKYNVRHDRTYITGDFRNISVFIEHDKIWFGSRDWSDLHYTYAQQEFISGVIAEHNEKVRRDTERALTE